MQIAPLTDVPADDDGIAARLLLDAGHCNVRVVRLGPGRALPAHTHGASDLVLYAVEGEGRLGTPDGDVPFAAGSVAHLRGDEELRVANTGTTGMTLLAVLAPPFP